MKVIYLLAAYGCAYLEGMGVFLLSGLCLYVHSENVVVYTKSTNGTQTPDPKTVSCPSPGESEAKEETGQEEMQKVLKPIKRDKHSFFAKLTRNLFRKLRWTK